MLGTNFDDKTFRSLLAGDGFPGEKSANKKAPIVEQAAGGANRKPPILTPIANAPGESNGPTDWRKLSKREFADRMFSEFGVRPQ